MQSPERLILSPTPPICWIIRTNVFNVYPKVSSSLANYKMIDRGIKKKKNKKKKKKKKKKRNWLDKFES